MGAIYGWYSSVDLRLNEQQTVFTCLSGKKRRRRTARLSSSHSFVIQQRIKFERFYCAFGVVDIVFFFSFAHIWKLHCLSELWYIAFLYRTYFHFVCVCLCFFIFLYVLKSNFWNFPFDLCVCEIMWSNDKTKISLWFVYVFTSRYSFSTWLFSIFLKATVTSLSALVRKNQHKHTNKQTKKWNSWSTAKMISDRMFRFKLLFFF